MPTLSIYLYYVCRSILSCLINQTVDQGIYEDFRINRYAQKITQLMFVDDILLFRRTNMQEADKLKSTLETYEKWSRQKVNYSKSTLYFSKNVNEEKNIISQLLWGPTDEE